LPDRPSYRRKRAGIRPAGQLNDEIAKESLLDSSAIYGDRAEAGCGVDIERGSERSCFLPPAEAGGTDWPAEAGRGARHRQSNPGRGGRPFVFRAAATRATIPLAVNPGTIAVR